jgi:hypothetical protein
MNHENKFEGKKKASHVNKTKNKKTGNRELNGTNDFTIILGASLGQ